MQIILINSVDNSKCCSNETSEQLGGMATLELICYYLKILKSSAINDVF